MPSVTSDILYILRFENEFRLSMCCIEYILLVSKWLSLLLICVLEINTLHCHTVIGQLNVLLVLYNNWCLIVCWLRERKRVIVCVC